MHPNQKYLEMFARKRRDGWSSYGDELEEQITSLEVLN
jgi:N6-adenosine-specific RNA methylase IME4